MSDLTWRDEFGDAEGLADALMEDQKDLIARGFYGAAGRVQSAADALRDQVAEIEKLKADVAALRVVVQEEARK